MIVILTTAVTTHLICLHWFSSSKLFLMIFFLRKQLKGTGLVLVTNAFLPQDYWMSFSFALDNCFLWAPTLSALGDQSRIFIIKWMREVLKICIPWMLAIFAIHALHKTAKQNNFHKISATKKVKRLKSITFLELLNCKKKITNTHCGDVNGRSQQQFHTLKCKVLQQRLDRGMLRAVHRWVCNAIPWRIQFKNFADFCHGHYLTLSILNIWRDWFIFNPKVVLSLTCELISGVLRVLWQPNSPTTGRQILAALGTDR